MKMAPEIRTIEPRKLVGMHVETTLSIDNTAELWQTFIPGKTKIRHRLGSHFFSVQVFDIPEGQTFTPETTFVKWAAVEVSDHTDIPSGMEPLTISGGKYAVFLHRGPASTFPVTAQFIFESWLPGSEFRLDDREQFEILGHDYRPDDPEAEEEVWIPIR